ncbi:glycosyltransferase family 4 protein [Tropicimonas sp.]|uniref:glycosyltransferase family 4 protein n=1 Tax=Tropicimonas sp. TaxID=2067044 RepID=UPI003A8547B2
MAGAEPRILVVTPFDDGWTWLSGYFAAGEYRWTFLRADLLQRGRRALVGHALRAALTARRHDVVITHGPWLTLFTAAFLRLLRIRRPHLAFTFNHGNGLFFSGPYLGLARRVLPSVDAFVTHSSYERDLLSLKYDIPIGKLHFTHWAIAAPERGRNRVDYVAREDDYACCIGRNNRDIPTFLEAVRRSGVRAVLICGERDAEGLDIPEGVTLRSGVPLAECEEVMEKAMVSVVPLLDDSTGAGHMTIVISLHYGTPVIATESPVLSDYVIDGRTGLHVPRGDAEALAAAISRLRDTPALRERLGTQGEAFAQASLSEQSAAAFLRRLLLMHAPERSRA